MKSYMVNISANLCEKLTKIELGKVESILNISQNNLFFGCHGVYLIIFSQIHVKIDQNAILVLHLRMQK